MWKLLVGFIIFAALAVFLLMKGGANVDMGGEKHGIETEATHETPHDAEPASAPETAPASAPASAASQ